MSNNNPGGSFRLDSKDIEEATPQRKRPPTATSTHDGASVSKKTRIPTIMEPSPPESPSSTHMVVPSTNTQIMKTPLLVGPSTAIPATRPSNNRRFASGMKQQRASIPIHQRIDFDKMEFRYHQDDYSKRNETMEQLKAQNAKHLESVNSARQDNARLEEQVRHLRRRRYQQEASTSQRNKIMQLLTAQNAKSLESLNSARQDNVRLQEQVRYLRRQCYQQEASCLQRDKSMHHLTAQNARRLETLNSARQENIRLQEQVRQFQRQQQLQKYEIRRLKQQQQIMTEKSRHSSTKKWTRPTNCEMTTIINNGTENVQKNADSSDYCYRCYYYYCRCASGVLSKGSSSC